MKKITNKQSNKKDFNIVLLSSFDSQILPHFLKELYSQDLMAEAIILDGIVNEKNRKIVSDRTEGFFEWPNFFDIEEYHIPVYFVKNHNGERCENLLKKIKPDVIVNAGTPRIIKENILAIPKRGLVNCHPGLLPEYKGCTVVEWAIYNNDPLGATCHFMDKGIDSGPIICSEVMPIAKGDIYEKVRTDMIFHGVKVMVEGLKKIRDENIHLNSLPSQKEGNYYKVIPEDKLKEVKNRLVKGLYKHYS